MKAHVTKKDVVWTPLLTRSVLARVTHVQKALIHGRTTMSKKKKVANRSPWINKEILGFKKG